MDVTGDKQQPQLECFARQPAPLLLGLLFLIILAAHAIAGTPDQQARLLAGLGSGAAVDPTRSAILQEHGAAMNKAWAAKDRALAAPRAWARANGTAASSGVLFYPFSGPDCLYAQTFFPNASTYILCGQEPVGSMPDPAAIPPDELAASLAQLRKSLSTILSFHYFITKDMRSDLAGKSVSGTLPVLCVFLARQGCQIQEITPMNQPAPGVKITFRNAAGASQSLYYFRTNLANGSCQKFLAWCEAQGASNALVKSASYLMHGDGFSQTRRFLLERCRLVVQDDSGIPWRNFDPRWKVQLYGTYTKPGDSFAKYYQADLERAFDAGSARPLGFGMGYHWQSDRGILMLAVRSP